MSPARAGQVWFTLALQLLLLLLVVRSFRLEERRGLFALMLLATAGALVHRRLPLRWRSAFFLAISLASFPLAFAWPHVAEAGWLPALAAGAQQAAWVAGIGAVLFGVCHLPLAFRWRVGLLIAVAGGLFYWRSDAIDPFWAVLGSMFMFRLWIYVRELRREKQAVPWSERLSYFFLLPNAFFPFFPIVDYRRFRDCRVADADGAVAQRGVAWILRGIMHLLLYRAVKIYLLPTPIDLIDVEYLALFLVTNYALYLQISGHFHIITGLLHLYGYDLARTHDRYFLASSFSDIWRRINIYWKDFLTEHVFYPAFFTLRRLPRSAAIMAAVGVTFLATWLLHSWQAFWLLGDFPVATRDAALWLSAGSLVAISSLWQYRAALAGTRPKTDVTPASALILTLKVVGTFATVSFFWACWTVPKFPQLLAAVAISGGITPRGVAVVGGGLLAVVAGGTLLQLAFARLRHSGIEPALPLERSPLACTATMALLVAAGTPAVHKTVGPELSQQIVTLQADPPPLPDANEGYYGLLAETNLQSDPLLGGIQLANRPDGVTYGEISRARNDVIGTELMPGHTSSVYGVPFRVNGWGMRDDDLPRPKPPGTYRIALLGSSTTMGHRVAQDEDFESLLEKRIAEAASPSGPHIELLNFAGPGHYALHSAAVLREKAFGFQLDAVYYVAHQGEYYGLPKHLTQCVRVGFPLPYPCLDEIVRRAGVGDDTSWGMTELLLKPHDKEVARCVYRGIVEDCRQRGVVPVWIYVPIPGVTTVTIDEGRLKALARRAGFVVVDLSDWAVGERPADLKFDESDYHANARGHRLIADRLFTALQNRPDALPPIAQPSERPPADGP